MIHKLIKLYGRFSIKIKMPIAFMLIGLLSVIMMASVTYDFYQKSVQEDYILDATRRLMQLHTNFGSVIDNYFLYHERSNLTQFLIDHPDVKSSSGEQLNEVKRELDDMAIGYMNSYPEILSIEIVRSDKQSNNNQSNPMDPTYNYFENYRNILFSSGKTTIYSIQNGNLIEDSTYNVIRLEIPLLKNIINSEPPIHSGYTLAIVLEPSFIKTAVDNADLLTNETILIVDDRQNILYAFQDNEQEIFTVLNQELVQVVSKDNKEVIYSQFKPENANWNYMTVIPIQAIASSWEYTPTSLSMTLLIVSITIMMIVPSMSGAFIEPVLKLQNLMFKVESGDFSVRAESKESHDEIQILNRSFNQMVSKLDELVMTVSDLKVKEVHMMVREKEAVIEAMQHQINPHFLYNSLDIIKSIAYLEEVPQIVQMTKGLADFYRYTAKTSQDRVTLLDEINYVKHYLSIIHVRFTSGFKSTLNVEPKYYNNVAIKLMLQPIVENSIKYAVEPNDGKGCVEVSASEVNGDLVVIVSDTGPGMSQSRLEWVDSQIRAFDKDVALESIRNKSIGIVSVHARIALMFGEDYGISIESSQNAGTQVKVKLPLKEV